MTQSESSPWQDIANELIRSFTGAFLFGIPFLYTMEMWWIAVYLDVGKLLSFFIMILGINYFLGHFIYPEKEVQPYRALAEAVVDMGIGMVAAAVVLVLVGRLGLRSSLMEILGKVLLETIPLSIGAAVARKIHRQQKKKQGQKERSERWDWGGVLYQAGGALAGAFFLSFPIAAVAEIQVLSAGTSNYHLIALMLFSLLVTYVIIYRSTLAPSWTGWSQNRLRTYTDTMLTYSTALVAAGITLYLFDRIELTNPLIHALSQIIVLALPATVGGAAGRRLV